MNCKFCNAELEEGVTLCPVCGKENLQESEAETPVEEAVTQEAAPVAEAAPVKKLGLKLWQIILAILGSAVLLVGLIVVVLIGMGVEVKIPENDINRKTSYTAEAPEKTADDVVAKIGDKKLTNAQLQVYYWMQVYDFLNYYGDYVQDIDLDYTYGLDLQNCTLSDENWTWQQYFLNAGLSTWQRYQTLCLLAEEAGYTLSEDYQTSLQNMPQTLEAMAAQYGFANADEMLQKEMGPGMTVEDYVAYMELSYLGLQFYEDQYKTFQPTEQELEIYFTAHEADYLEDNITKDSGSLVDVRHILIGVEGGTTDAEGKTTYSDAEWETCRQKAQDILDQWLTGEKTEATFAELANKHSQDGGSNTKGGLYSLVQKNQMVAEFDAWIFDETRQLGDYGLVKTQFGYHIMFFVGSQEIWSYRATNDYITDKSTELIESGMEKHPMKVTYKKINIGEVDLGGGADTTQTIPETTGATEANATEATKDMVLDETPIDVTE